jgi:hypothetical protein
MKLGEQGGERPDGLAMVLVHQDDGARMHTRLDLLDDLRVVGSE